MTITQGGMMVYPRLEAAMHRDGIEEPPGQWTRVGTGASRLDQVLGGGIPSGSATLVAGVPGAGKTTLALSFLAEGGRAGEKGIYFGFDEAPSRLIARADTLGFGLGDMVKDGTLEVRWMPPLMPIPDQVAWQLLDAVDDAGARRAVIDGLDPVMAVLESFRRAEPFLAALMTALRSRSVTTIATSRLSRDPSAERRPAYEQMSAFDNVIHLQQVEARSEVHRLISVAKLRDSDFDTAIREFTISGGGLHVTDPFGGAEGGVTGIGHWRGRRAR
jgi:circadian clock protein KaiC